MEAGAKARPSPLFTHENTVSDQGVLAALGRDEVDGVIVEKAHLEAGMVAVLNQVNGAILRNDKQTRPWIQMSDQPLDRPAMDGYHLASGQRPSKSRCGKLHA